MAIKDGYILISRRIDGSKISEFPPHVREIWLYLLRKANYTDRIVSGITIKRGQLLTSYKEIIKDLSWFVGYRKESYKKHHCEISTKLLTKEQMVTTTKTTRGILITICNYDYYQDPKNYETDSENFKKATRKRQSNDTINKKDKKEKKVIDTVPPIPPLKNSDKKIAYAEYVSMTNAEYQALVTKIGEQAAKRCIEILDNYKGAKGKTYKSDYRAILNWVIDRYNEENNKQKQNGNIKQDRMHLPAGPRRGNSTL